MVDVKSLLGNAELVDRPKNVTLMFTNVTLNSFMIMWEGVCGADKSPVVGYNISWYNGRDIIGSSLVPSLCEEDSQNESLVANFTSDLAVDFVSVSAENICGVGEATNITNGTYRYYHNYSLNFLWH